MDLDRRALFGGPAALIAASSASAAPALRGIDPNGADFAIARVQATPVLTEDVFDYGGVRKPTRGAGVYVEVETRGGLVGHGMTTIVDSGGVAQLANTTAARAITGMNALANEAVWDKLYWTLSPRGQTGIYGHVIGAIDIALWDIKGKALGVPIATLLGGARAKAPVYVTFGPAFLNREELVAVAKAMVAEGYKGLKMVVGDGALEDRDRRPLEDVVKEDIARFRAVRDAVGPDVLLHVDGNCSLDYPSAERLAQALGEMGLHFFEEPLTQNDVRMMAELRRRTGVPLAAGQNEALAFRFRDFLVGEAVDYVQPNVMNSGGYTQCARIAGMAAAFNVGIHNGGAGALQNLHLHAGLANGGFCEWHLPWMGLNFKLYRNIPRPVQGYLAVPDRPGLGFEADPAAVKAFGRPI
jgi:L-alanine-DL-glutamate epimerase-like enolase superfamily enzyme